MKNQAFKTIAGLVLAVSGLAQAQSPNPFCYIQSRNQEACELSPGCQFVPARNNSGCRGRPEMSPTQTQFCYIQNNNPKQCNEIPFCQYAVDVVPSKCVSIVQDDTPAPAPNPYCYIQNGRPGACNQVPGCRYIYGRNESACIGREGMDSTQTQFCYIQNNNPKNCNEIPFCQYVDREIPGRCVSIN